MLLKATMDDFEAELDQHVKAALSTYLKSAHKIHTSKPFSFLWGGDDRLERLLDLIETAVRDGSDNIANATLLYMNSTELEKLALYSHCTSKGGELICRILDDAAMRLSLLADSPAAKEFTGMRMGYILEYQKHSVQRVALGMPSAPIMPPNSGNVIHATTINGNIQQGSPGATIIANADVDLERLSYILKLAESTLNAHQLSEQSDIRKNISTIAEEVKKSKPDNTVIRTALGSLKSISKNITANVLAPEVTAIITLLTGTLK